MAACKADKNAGKNDKKLAEADICAGFIAAVQSQGDWTAYPETAGFDILLARKADGVQIGIEAKLALNAKVLSQALPRWLYDAGTTGPDYRAVLVPFGCTDILSPLAGAIGITVIRLDTNPNSSPYCKRPAFGPSLPEIGDRYWYQDPNWHEWAPMQRCKLPDYVPDVGAGNSAPIQLTDWKIKAIKLAIILEDRPVTRADFKALKLDPKRWVDPFPGWLKRTESGFVPAAMPNFKAQHPLNYEQIKADREKWMPAPVPDVISEQKQLPI